MQKMHIGKGKGMKEIAISLWELTKEETVRVPEQQILIYNTLTGNFSIEWNTHKSFIGRSKYASDKLKYFSFKETKLEEK